MPSSSSGPPNTTAGRPRCSGPGSTTRSSCSRPASPPGSILTGGKANGDRTTEAASARDYAIRHGVPAEAILMDERSRTTLESIRAVGGAAARRTTSTTRSSSRTGRTCCGSCGWPPTTASTAWGSPTVDQPDRARSGPSDRRDAARARGAGPVLPDRQRVLTVPPDGRFRDRTDFPLGAEGLAPYTVPKPVEIGSPQGPRHHPHLSRSPLAPPQRKGAREAG